MIIFSCKKYPACVICSVGALTGYYIFCQKSKDLKLMSQQNDIGMMLQILLIF